jgi:hypothetical protein
MTMRDVSLAPNGASAGRHAGALLSAAQAGRVVHAAAEAQVQAVVQIAPVAQAAGRIASSPRVAPAADTMSGGWGPLRAPQIRHHCLFM